MGFFVQKSDLRFDFAVLSILSISAGNKRQSFSHDAVEDVQ